MKGTPEATLGTGGPEDRTPGRALPIPRAAAGGTEVGVGGAESVAGRGAGSACAVWGRGPVGRDLSAEGRGLSGGRLALGLTVRLRQLGPGRSASRHRLLPGRAHLAWRLSRRCSSGAGSSARATET